MIAQVRHSQLPLLPSTRLGLVSIPESDGIPEFPEEALDHEQARGLLRDLAGNLGLKVLVPRDESFPAALATGDSVFPDEAVRKCLEGLDSVWLDGEAVVAVFAIETGWSGFEGARRLADLLALHPKLKAPLYAVTLDALKPALIAEVNRPLFAAPKRRLSESLRLLDWNRLHREVEQLGDRVRYLKSEFLEGIADRIEAP